MKLRYICSLILLLCATQSAAASSFYFKTILVEMIEEGQVTSQSTYPHFLSIGEINDTQWRFQWFDPQGPMQLIDLAEPEDGHTANGSYFRFMVLDKSVAYSVEMELFWQKKELETGQSYSCIISLNGEGVKAKFYGSEDKASMLARIPQQAASASKYIYSHKQLHLNPQGEKSGGWNPYHFELIKSPNTENPSLKQSLGGRAQNTWQLQYAGTQDLPDEAVKLKLYTYQNAATKDTIGIIQYDEIKLQDTYEYDHLIIVSKSSMEGTNTDFFFGISDVSSLHNGALTPKTEPVKPPVEVEPESEVAPKPSPKPKKKKQKAERGPLSDTKELSLTIGSNPHNLVYDAGWIRRIKIGRVGNIQLGLRLGLTQGEGFDFSNVPLSREAFSGPIDSFRMDKWQTHSLNAVVGLELNLGRRLRLGGRVDIGGISGGLFQLGSMIFLDGPDDTGIFLPGTLSQEQGIGTESAKITVTQFAKIWGPNPSGNLAGEVYLRLRILQGLSLRGGMRLNQYSLTTEAPLGISQTQDFLNYDQTWFLGLQVHLMSDW